MLVLTQRQILRLQGLQPGADRLLRHRRGDHRQGVDEQTDLLFNAFEVGRTASHRGAEAHAVLAGVALQQQQPGGLHQGVEGDFLLPGKGVQAFGQGGVEAVQVIAIADSAAGRTQQRVGQAGRRAQRTQLTLPEGLAGGAVLALQPVDVMAVACRFSRQPLAAVALQHFAEQTRVAPAVHKDVVVGVDQVIALFAGANHRHAQQRRTGQVEALLTVVFSPGVQRLGEILTAAPVEVAERHLQGLVHHLQRLLQIALPDEAAAQDVMPRQRRLPGLGKAFGIEPFDVQAHLVDVVAGRLFVQGVEHHALLHR
ncbi:hypothetical protein D3C81_1146180 [compost metagenome]